MPKLLVFTGFFVKLLGYDFYCQRLVNILVTKQELLIMNDLRQLIRSEFNQEWNERW